jgi:hypothetical protein
MTLPGSEAPTFAFDDLTRICTPYALAPEFVSPVVSIIKALPYLGSIVAIAICVVLLDPLPPESTAVETPYGFWEIFFIIDVILLFIKIFFTDR